MIHKKAFPSKKPIHIAVTIMKHWVALYVTIENFLSDNGGEFINDNFMTLNINVYTNGAKSLWSNGIVERYSSVLSEMLSEVRNY